LGLWIAALEYIMQLLNAIPVRRLNPSAAEAPILRRNNAGKFRASAIKFNPAAIRIAP